MIIFRINLIFSLKSFKEILPIYIKSKMAEIMKDLSVEVIKNVSSYLLGDPKYIKLKHNEALKTIQRKYKLQLIKQGSKIQPYHYNYRYKITRQIPIPINKISEIIKNQKDYIREITSENIESMVISLYVYKKCVNGIGRETIKSDTFEPCGKNDLETTINRAERKTSLMIRFVEDPNYDVRVLSIINIEFDIYVRKSK